MTLKGRRGGGKLPTGARAYTTAQQNTHKEAVGSQGMSSIEVILWDLVDPCM